MKWQPALAAFLLMAASVPSQAEPLDASDSVHVTALAVAETAQGFVGVHADVEARVLAGGSGAVFVATKPLAQTDMQGSARLAAQVAASTLGLDWRRYDYLVEFRSDSTVIGGPSAGAVMTLALTTALQHVEQPTRPWVLNASVAATGTINPDGTIGPVGGIPAKAEGARDAGITTFLYPAGLDQATTQTVVNGVLRTVAVDMAEHCANLGIACHPVATLRDVVQFAAGVTLEQVDAPVPNTEGYADILGAGVAAQVDALAVRIAAGEPTSNLVPARNRATATDLWTQADAALAAARASLANASFYLAATQAFQGNIHAARAENATAFYTAEDAEVIVQEALAGCDAAVATVAYVEALEAHDRNALDAIGAAQVRLVQARELQQNAHASYANAFTYNDWLASAYDAAFCVERVKTVTWWADLQAQFGPGPAIADVAALASATLDQARDMVLYAEAVLGSAQEARAKLQEAEDHIAAGRMEGAVIAAVEAQTSASVAVQLGSSTQVPASVLEAALQGASRAIQRLRADGAEPILAVSLIELATGQDPSRQLSAYWEARSLALAEAGAIPVDVPPGPAPPPSPAPIVRELDSVSNLVSFGAMGLVLGFALAMVVMVMVLVARK